MKPKINKTITTRGGGNIIIPNKIISKEYPDNEGGGGAVQEPNLLGCINSEDIIQFLDINGDGQITDEDGVIASNNYHTSIANDCHYNASYVNNLIQAADPGEGETGIKTALFDENLLFPLRLSSEGGERWAMVDYFYYLEERKLKYAKYLIYDGKPNLAQKLVVFPPPPIPIIN